jgi:hypothetical protein
MLPIAVSHERREMGDGDLQPWRMQLREAMRAIAEIRSRQ